jgi:hypothetical protein
LSQRNDILPRRRRGDEFDQIFEVFPEQATA